MLRTADLIHISAMLASLWVWTAAIYLSRRLAQAQHEAAGLLREAKEILRSKALLRSADQADGPSAEEDRAQAIGLLAQVLV